VLVLLILFMTIAPTAGRGLETALPRPAEYERVVEALDTARGAGADRLGVAP